MLCLGEGGGGVHNYPGWKKSQTGEQMAIRMGKE